MSKGTTITNTYPDLDQMLFTHLPVGIAVLDREFRLVRWNRAWADFIGRYTAAEFGLVKPGMHLFDLIPGTQNTVTPLLQTSLAGETLRKDALRLETAGVVTYWDAVFAPVVEQDQVLGVVVMASDATERVHAYQDMERRIHERTYELSTMLEVSHNLASTLELEPLLGLILEQLRLVVPYTGASILALEAEVLAVRAYRGPIPTEDACRLRFPLEQAGANRDVILRREPVVISDVRGGDPSARAFQASAGVRLDSTFGYIRSWMGVPLLLKERVIGMLSLDNSQPNYYDAQHARLVLAFANQAALAMENARLFQAEQDQLDEAERRRQVAEGLRDMLAILNSSRSLDEVLVAILAQAGRILGNESGAIFRRDPETQVLRIQAAQGLPEQHVQNIILPVGLGVAGQAALELRPVAVTNLKAVGAALLEQAEVPAQRASLQWVQEHYHGVVAAPLLIEGEVYGSIVLYFREERALSPEDIDLVATFAGHVALAIENAHLREQAQEAAVAAERSRLARDLHDAVTQTLFSASLIAEVLPRLWERSPDEGRRRLEELRQLTRGALAEMRSLLLELRPSALVEASLVTLLRQLAEAITGRSRIPVSLVVEGQDELPPDVKISLYRIAQEALNNVAKHSGAGHAEISLSCVPEGVSLAIADNGVGFDTDGITAEHLGVRIMRERAQTAGAALLIQSYKGLGTQIRVRWARPQSSVSEAGIPQAEDL